MDFMVPPTQSRMYFPEKDVADWYTVPSEVPIGRGSFGIVLRAIDDREPLLRMKYRIYADEVDGPLLDWNTMDDNIYYLENEPQGEEIRNLCHRDVATLVGREQSWEKLACYLSFFTFASLSSIYDNLFFGGDSLHSGRLERSFNSRYELIMAILSLSCDGFNREAFEARLGAARPPVALKILQPSNTINLENVASSSKTEVFGLGSVCSDVPLFMTPPDRYVGGGGGGGGLFDDQIQDMLMDGHQSITVFSTMGDDRKVLFTVHSLQRESSVADLKRAITDLSGVPGAKQRLLLPSGKALAEEEMLDDYFSEDQKMAVQLVVIEGRPHEKTKTALVTCLQDYFFTAAKSQFIRPRYTVVMSLVKGPSLDGLMKSSGLLPARFAWYVAWAMSKALMKVHSCHIIHNDVKLDNILFDMGTGAVSLVDFGLSCHVKIGEAPPGEMDSCDAMGGTLDYSSNEHHRLHKRYPVSDVWALGVVLWELAMGETYVVRGQNAHEVISAIVAGASPMVNAIDPHMLYYGSYMVMLTNMLKYNPDQRWNAKQVHDFINDRFKNLGQTDAAIGSKLREGARVAMSGEGMPQGEADSEGKRRANYAPEPNPRDAKRQK